jgi:hypothetical protein
MAFMRGGAEDDDEEEPTSITISPEEILLPWRRLRKTEAEEGDASAEFSNSSSPESSNQQRKKQFLDRIAVLSSWWMRREDEAYEVWSRGGRRGTRQELESHPDLDLRAVTEQSDLARPGRHVHIVTTAALPWMTGTAVNPLLRAAYLHRRTQEINSDSSERWVTLVLPWLELPEDQEELYGRVFESQQEQEDYIRNWLREDADLPDVADPDTGLQLLFYPARYHAGMRSIFAMGDIIQTVIEPTGTPMDVCVLEEPEHCNWFRAPGDGWTKQFQFVVGIVHTSTFDRGIRLPEAC